MLPPACCCDALLAGPGPALQSSAPPLQSACAPACFPTSTFAMRSGCLPLQCGKSGLSNRQAMLLASKAEQVQHELVEEEQSSGPGQSRQLCLKK